MKKQIFFLMCFLFMATICVASPKTNEGAAVTMANYGNWCGPNHPKDISSAPEPIDVLDAACMRHDLCYEDEGYLNCHCDEIFRTEIKQNLKAQIYDGVQRVYAKSADLHFAVSPCDGDGKGKAGPSRALHGLYNGAKVRFTRIINRITGTGEGKEQDSMVTVPVSDKQAK